jgi:hypothetical protein
MTVSLGDMSVSQRFALWFFAHRYLLDLVVVLVALRLPTSVVYEIVRWLPNVCLYRRARLMHVIVGVNESVVALEKARDAPAAQKRNRRRTKK